jgi:hypothetical protein
MTTAQALLSKYDKRLEEGRADPVHRKQPIQIDHHLSLLLTNQGATISSLPRSCHVAFMAATDQENRCLKARRRLTGENLLNALHFISNGYAGYHLPYHKADPFFRGTNILFSPQESADPVSLLHDNVQARDKRHGACRALFIREDGSHPMRAWFDSKLFHSLTGHLGANHHEQAGLRSLLLLDFLNPSSDQKSGPVRLFALTGI